MRIGGRLQAAIEVLEAIEQHHKPVANALKDWGSSHRFAGSGDRGAIGNIVYDALRMKLSHGYMMGDDSPRAIAFAVLLRQWGMTIDDLKNQLDGDKFAPEFLSDAQMSQFQNANLTQADEHVQGDIPQWLMDDFKRAFGDDWLIEAQALTQRPSLDLRVNTLRSTREKVLNSLSKTNAVAGDLLADSVRITADNGPGRLPNVAADIPFAKGWFEIQDEGSQLAAALTDGQKGEQVLDYCAGGGGKSLALSAAMDNSGQIHTYDNDRRRMAPMIERLRRAGTRNVQLIEDDEALAQLLDNCDKVLVDAPCSGTGTWRRRPDTKWRLSEKSLATRLNQQKEVINKASQYVRPGGELTYVTCSVLPQENDAIVSKFLDENSNFEAIDLSQKWVELTGRDDVPRSHTGIGILCSPHRTGTDGFFVAKLNRVA
ncbi:MAG: RsmB/NOP family class I SAM-dependent RNA methyltransferase [Rhizobiaceae bacterium]|nr:RsmB/NOP family class I SAM-dependent RNA methyltransferase [Rhizobiaceae bacterium]